MTLYFVLSEISAVEVDQEGEKVRPTQKQNTLILREIPDSTSQKEVEQLFDNENCPAFKSCRNQKNNCWFVEFATEEEANQAHKFLTEQQTYQNKPIKVSSMLSLSHCTIQCAQSQS